MNWARQQQVIYVTRYEPKCCVTNPIKKPVRIERYVPPGAIRSMQIAGASPGCCSSTVIQKDIVKCLCLVRNGTMPAGPAPTPIPAPLRIVWVGSELTNSVVNPGFYRGSATSASAGATWSATLGDDIQDDVGFLSTFFPSCVAYGNGRWMAGGQITSGASAINPAWRPMVTSTDGVTWTYTTGAFVNSCVGVAYGNGRWIVTGGPLTTTSLVTSTNGLSFTDISTATGLPAVAVYSAIHYANGRWVLGASGSTSGVCMFTSTDGLTWNACTGDTFTNGSCWDVKYDGTRWVSVGWQDSSTPPGSYTITTSTDGINWTQNNTASFATSGSYTGSYGYRLAYGNGRWFAIGAGTEMLTSTNGGITWSTIVPTGVTLTDYIGIVWSGTQWILTGAGSPVLFTSTDGLVWSANALVGISSSGTRLGTALAVGS